MEVLSSGAAAWVLPCISPISLLWCPHSADPNQESLMPGPIGLWWEGKDAGIGQERSR